MHSDQLLIHWLDREMGHYGGVEDIVAPPVLEQMLRETFAMATLVARRGVVVPASSLFENPLVPPLLEDMAPFREAGLVRFVGGDESADDFIEAKRESYARDPGRHPAYRGRQGSGLARLIAPHWLVKRSSTTRAIAQGWTAAAEIRDDAWLSIVERTGGARRFENVLTRVPELLGTAAFIAAGTAAFIADFAADVFERESGTLVDAASRSRMNDLISRMYLHTYAHDLDAGVLAELPFLDTDRYLSPGVERMSLNRLRMVLDRAGFVERLPVISAEDLVALRTEHIIRDVLDDAARRACAVGELFSVQEAAALSRRRRRLALFRRTRTPPRAILDDAERYLTAVGSVEARPMQIMSTFNFDNNILSGTMSFGGNQYVLADHDHVLEAVRAVLGAALESDDALQMLKLLDARVTEAGSATAADLEVVAREQLEVASPSRRREFLEKLAAGTGGGLIVQAVLAAINAM